VKRITQTMTASLALLVAVASPVRAKEITAAGKYLAKVLDSMEVEKYWQAGERVNWRTGKPDPEAPNCPTHCSAFVAAACARLGVYIQRPPEHSQILLASSQQRWLEHEGPKQGWKQVKGAWHAQELANRGVLVVASYKNPDRNKPGHIAVVRPSTRDEKEVEAEGPEITQAGQNNYRSTTLKAGFRHHADAFARGEILFFAHEVPDRKEGERERP
jgi:hypothetical protein